MNFGGKTTGSSGYGKKVMTVGALRRSHLLMAYGPGALVDLPEYSVIMGASDYWEYPKMIHEPRLEAMLGVKGFKKPKASEDLYKSGGVIRAMRFPYWHYCSKCGRLGPYWIIGTGNKKKKCADPHCNGELIPSRFVAACEHGHIEDFPYEFWVHYNPSNRFGKCPSMEGKHPRMRIEFSTRLGGLESIRIICEECGHSRILANATAKGAINPHYCRGLRPWVGNRSEDKDSNGCGREMRVLQRGASNVYYPINRSALTIPSHRSYVLRKNYQAVADCIAKCNGDLEQAAFYLAFLLKYELEEAGIAAEELVDEYVRETDKPKVSIRMRDIFEAEYRALCAPDTEEEDFKTTHVAPPTSLEGLIEDVTLVRRLKEVLVLSGFRRITPESEDAEEAPDNDYMSPHANPQDWLPAMELRGEGLFIRINLDALSTWAKSVEARYNPMKERLLQSAMVRCTNFSPELVMLHTLSHILIRQLTIDCGYSGSSLKERIYSSWSDSDQEMAGILIYTSASDSDGSLGGLVRQGSPDRLLETFRNALGNASWCSSDPVCSESTAQGLESLNYAACHACTLLPETSCALRNCLLDRTAVVGRIDNTSLGFFGRWMDEAQQDFGKKDGGVKFADEHWQSIYEVLFDCEAQSFARRAAALGIESPDEAGYDGIEDVMAEMVWLRPKICYLTEGQMVDAELFKRRGWKVIGSKESDTAIRQAFDGRA